MPSCHIKACAPAPGVEGAVAVASHVCARRHRRLTSVHAQWGWNINWDSIFWKWRVQSFSIALPDRRASAAACPLHLAHLSRLLTTADSSPGSSPPQAQLHAGREPDVQRPHGQLPGAHPPPPTRTRTRTHHSYHTPSLTKSILPLCRPPLSSLSPRSSGSSSSTSSRPSSASPSASAPSSPPASSRATSPSSGP